MVVDAELTDCNELPCAYRTRTCTTYEQIFYIVYMCCAYALWVAMDNKWNTLKEQSNAIHIFLLYYNPFFFVFVSLLPMLMFTHKPTYLRIYKIDQRHRVLGMWLYDFNGAFCCTAMVVVDGGIPITYTKPQKYTALFVVLRHPCIVYVHFVWEQNKTETQIRSNIKQ